LLEILKSAAHAGDLKHTFAPVRAGDVKFGNASIQKIESALGYKRSVSMEEGLDELLRSATSVLEIKVQQGQSR
jgi:hypothetical protein